MTQRHHGPMSTAINGGPMSTTTTPSGVHSHLSRHGHMSTGTAATPPCPLLGRPLRPRTPSWVRGILTTGHLSLLPPPRRDTAMKPHGVVWRATSCAPVSSEHSARDHRRAAERCPWSTLACARACRACAARSMAATALIRAAPPVSKLRLSLFNRALLIRGTWPRHRGLCPPER